MKFELKNLGPINEASIELADLTIICGQNNSGKTYLTYSLYSFLKIFKKHLFLPIDDLLFENLMKQGKLTIDLEAQIESYISEIENLLPDFCKTLPRFLAMNAERFRDTVFNVDLNIADVRASLIQGSDISAIVHAGQIQITENCMITLHRKSDSFQAEVELLNSSAEMPHRDIIRQALGLLLAQSFNVQPDKDENLNKDYFNSLFPSPFTITCERTGAALFRTELLMSRELSLKSDTGLSEIKELSTKYEYQGYQFPVSQDLQFVIQLKDAEKQQSFIAKNHPDILDFFNSIIGGAYTLKDNQVKFSPKGSQETLTLPESSSTVRSLMELNYYLKHLAQRGQILMLDEPELNLHPANQRKIARLLAMLVNAGIKVFINTHSDYIIREFNILIMLNAAKAKLASLIEEYGYAPNELLSAAQVKCYVAEQGTFNVMDVNDEYGIEVTSFDDSISEINLLQNRILFGD